MAQIFYRVLCALVPFVIFFSFSCKPVTDPTVGSPQDTPIPNTVVAIDTTYIANSSFYARGTATNNGAATIEPPWYVECQFYSDSTYKLKLGGNNTPMQLPLEYGKSALWTISYYSPNVDVRLYPNFRVGDQRAIYKK